LHILLVADGRSPTTQSYFEMLQSLDLQVSLLSTYPCRQISGLSAFAICPVAFAGLAGSQVGKTDSAASSTSISPRQNSARPGISGRFKQHLHKLVYPIRYNLGPLTVPWYRQQYLAFLDQVNPDLVHALRIPFEGLLASQTPASIPLVVSTWGNDLTYHARRSPAMRRWTHRTLSRVNGLVADTRRDIRLAQDWGLAADKWTLVVPGSGGLLLDRIDQPRLDLKAELPEKLRKAPALVINPRGFRPGSVRNDTFFQAVPLVLSQQPDVLFACSAMQGQPEAQGWVEHLGIQDAVLLLPYLMQESLWEIFRLAQVSVSISQHDGTPNSLLEAMACGCFPVAGDIESLREWITTGENGLLVDPTNPQMLAEAMLKALSDPDLRLAAARRNRSIVETRASREVTASRVLDFYKNIVP
jgi:glycosyltransferase involved in cell wall biosynthesis